VLSVQDNGPGIASQDLEHIFEPFYTKKYLGRSGTGLGLAIVWNTLKNHNGSVTVNSDANGTQFQLYFPLKAEATVEESSSFELPKDALGQGEKVLIIDDETGVREIAGHLLSAHGYVVQEVDSGEEAISYLKENQVDIIVLDMLMDPGINGLETYKQILQISPNQKAVISSGFSENDDVESTIELGAGAFVKKPFTKEQLCLAVRQVLDA